MFTSIPVSLVMRILNKKKEEIEILFNQEFDLFIRITSFVLEDCAVFQYDEIVYKQRKG